MRKKSIPLVKKIILCVVVVGVLIGYACLFLDTKKTIVLSTEYALEEAIEKDYQEREFAELKSSSGRLGRKVKGVTIVTENGEEDFEFKDSIDERIAHRLATQYLLAQIHPLHPDTLNTLLQDALKKQGFTIPSGIVYAHNGQKQYSDKDSMAVHRPFLYWSRTRTLDVKRTVSVQVWIGISPWHLFRNVHSGAFWSLLMFGIVTFWAILTWGKEDATKAKFGKMLLDKISRKVTIHGKECKLRNQEFLLLLLFVEKPNHTLSRNEIRCAFWKDEQGTDNRVSNLLSTLRNALKDFPECQIIANEEDGYELAWTDTNEEDVKSKNTGTSLGLVDNQ